MQYTDIAPVLIIVGSKQRITKQYSA